MDLLAAAALYLAGWGLARYWLLRAQRPYFNELDRRGDAHLTLGAELAAVNQDPMGGLATSPRRAVKRIRAMVERQQDPDLERLRQECLRRRLVVAVVFWGGMVLLVAYAITHRP